MICTSEEAFEDREESQDEERSTLLPRTVSFDLRKPVGVNGESK